MNTLLSLMAEFFKTGLFSVGGGLATLPFLYEMSSNHPSWFSHADVADMIAISESTPGAIGINMSTYAGFTTAGIPGGILATLGLALPSVIIILIIAKFLEKFRTNKLVEGAFYGLRPASLAMISVAGLNVARVALVNIPAFQASGHRTEKAEMASGHLHRHFSCHRDRIQILNPDHSSTGSAGDPSAPGIFSKKSLCSRSSPTVERYRPKTWESYGPSV